VSTLHPSSGPIEHLISTYMSTKRYILERITSNEMFMSRYMSRYFVDVKSMIGVKVKQFHSTPMAGGEKV
jgi:hypothetical protein